MTDTIWGGDQSTEEKVDTSQSAEEDLLQKLVGEGKKFRTLDDLAKGKAEADRYIEELKAKVSALEEAETRAQKAEELLARLQREAPASTSERRQPSMDTFSNTSATNDQSDTTTRLGEDDLERLLEQKLTEREKRATASANLQQVEETLRSTFGANVATVIQTRSQELGISVERMKTLGAESPSALLSLLGADAKGGASGSRPGVNAQALAQAKATGERDWSYYENLRKTNRKLYLSPKTQQQLFQDRERLGAKFGV